eukprot:TRINITY_DN21549_c0_g1_i1.p1 TRINITY_DN21549_c0_g1~~TRINITY_DN21549_c0_g1_i1.p1  ORF type:complete len:490 (+),score=158.03 TRINITY_DN21549_c0_g1_i1:187-1656(+)
MSAPVSKKRRFDAVPVSDPLKRPKVSQDVYPDPEPDDPAEIAAAISSRLQILKEAKPVGKIFTMDSAGRLTDEYGNVVEEEKPVVQKKPVKEEDTAGLFDPALERASRTTTGRKGLLQIAESQETSDGVGKYTRQADKMRRLEEARNEYAEKRRIADEALEAGGSMMVDPDSAGMIQEKVVAEVNTSLLEVPDAEWWDEKLLVNKSYSDVTADPSPLQWGIKGKLVTSLVEHPVPSKGQHVSQELAPQPLLLPKRQRAKLRKQTRIAREKEKQKQIAMGLLPPPPPKVKISNMARVFQHRFIEDPTACEAFTREEMAKRVMSHEARNQERKLSKDERREKTIKKLQSQAETDPVTTVYRLDKLHSSKAIFQIVRNAEQLYLTGFLVQTDTGSNMLIVEGGKRPLRKYDRVVRHRTDYMLDDGKTAADNATVVWTGVAGLRRFSEFKKVSFVGDAQALQYLNSMECGPYWEMMVAGTEQSTTVDCDELLG